MADASLRVRPWRRFHVRMALSLALAMLVVATVTAEEAYRLVFGVWSEGLREQLGSLTRLTAQQLDADAIAALPLRATDAHRLLREELGQVGHSAPGVTSVYVLRYDPDPTRLQFIADWSFDGSEAGIGERYDASELPVLLQGFQAPVVEARPYRDDWGWSLSAYAPLHTRDGELLGLVGVDVDADSIYEVRRQVLLLVVTSWGIGMLLIVGIAWAVGRSVRAPLARMVEAASAVASGDFDTRLELRRDDEFGLLGAHFDRMAAGLRERELIRDTFGRYVSPEVARRLLAEQGTQLGGEEREVTVLFSDLAGYTSISEVLTPTAVVSLLNTYLGAMDEVVDAHGGTLVAFIADAILVVFNAPTEMEDHPERAVRCALAMQDRLAALNQQWHAEGLATPLARAGRTGITHRIGVHTGPVVAGNIGSATRLSYTVIGDAVNVAARLEQLNKEVKTEMLVSGETRDRLPEVLRDRLIDRGTWPVKGRQTAVRVYGP